MNVLEFDHEISFAPPPWFERRVENHRTIRYAEAWIAAWFRVIGADLERRLELPVESVVLYGPHRAEEPERHLAPMRVGYRVLAHRKVASGSEKGQKALFIAAAVRDGDAWIAWSGDRDGGSPLHAFHRPGGVVNPFPKAGDRLVHRT